MKWTGVVEPLEALLEFLYLAPVGIMRFGAGGEIDMVNAAAAQLLVPLDPTGMMSNAFVALAPLIPDLAGEVAHFAPTAGAIVTHHRSAVEREGARPMVLSLTVTRLDADAYMAVVEDVTVLVEQERIIFEDRQRFHAIFSYIRDYAIFVIGLDGQLREWNESLERIGGWKAHDVAGQHLSLFSETADAGQVDQLLAEALRTGSAETEGWLQRRDRSQIWANSVITALPSADGAISGYVVIARDMSERKRLEDELRQLATTDPLTGAYNRRWGQDQIARALAKRARDGAPFTLLMLDLDHFKSINDRLGHEMGDTALRAFVTACAGALRVTDALVRWGGEEFLALLPGTPGDRAASIAERIRAAVAAIEIEVPEGGSFGFTVSIGLAEADVDTLDNLVRRADEALYEAKSSGRNCVALAPATA